MSKKKGFLKQPKPVSKRLKHTKICKTENVEVMNFKNHEFIISSHKLDLLGDTDDQIV